MGVYVDKAKNPYGKMLMSHLIADSLEELHEAAFKIGIQRKWFQDKDMPHYDICQSKKKLLMDIYGDDIEIDNKKLVELIRKNREKRNNDNKT